MKQKLLTAREARKLTHELRLLGIKYTEQTYKSGIGIRDEICIVAEMTEGPKEFRAIDQFISYCHQHSLQLSKEVLR